jgi:hypothetical protein
VKPSDMSHLKATLIDLPGIEKMTEKESAHPSQKQLDKLTKSSLATPLFATGNEYSDLTKQVNYYLQDPGRPSRSNTRL